MVDIRVFGSSSKGNSYLLTDGDSSLLLEAGVQPKQLTVDWTKVDGILITHEHGDHAKYVGQVIKRCGANVYCTRGTASFLDIPKHRIYPIKKRITFNIGAWRILPFEVEHDVAEPVGFLIHSPSGKKILFATDTYYIKYKFSDLTHIMIECNYSLERLEQQFQIGKIDKKRRDRLLSSHFELGNVKEFLKANSLSKLEQIYLLHLSDSNSDAAYFKEEIERVTGVTVTVA